MHSPAASAPIPDARRDDEEVSLLRLYVLRATYLLLFIGLGQMILPELVGHRPMAQGVVPSLLGAIWLLALVGLRYPLQMLPLLMFEFVWKALWMFDYGLPQWYTGQLPPTFAEDFPAIAFGVVLMPLVIPWGYVYRHYVKAAGDRWGRHRPV